jgi:hypothetical protein
MRAPSIILRVEAARFALAPGAAAHGPGRRLAARIRIGREHALQHAHAADAVHQRVMHLHVEREAVVFEPFNDVRLPQRAVEVHRVRVQARDQHAELALAAGLGQRGMAQVVVEVDVLGLDPGRHHRFELGRGELEVERPREARHSTQVLEQTLQEITRGTLGQGENGHAGDLHRRIDRVDVKPGRIQGLECLHLVLPRFRPAHPGP